MRTERKIRILEKLAAAPTAMTAITAQGQAAGRARHKRGMKKGKGNWGQRLVSKAFGQSPKELNRVQGLDARLSTPTGRFRGGSPKQNVRAKAANDSLQVHAWEPAASQRDSSTPWNFSGRFPKPVSKSPKPLLKSVPSTP